MSLIYRTEQPSHIVMKGKGERSSVLIRLGCSEGEAGGQERYVMKRLTPAEIDRMIGLPDGFVERMIGVLRAAEMLTYINGQIVVNKLGSLRTYQTIYSYT